MIEKSFFDSLFGLILLINLVLGVLVYLKNRKDLRNKLFFGLTLGTVLWIGGLLLLGLTPYNMGGRLSFAGALLSGWFFLWFTLKFPYQDIKISFPGEILANILVISFFIIILFSPLVVVKEITEETTFGVTGEFGPLYPFFGIFFILLMILGLLNLFRKVKLAKNEIEKKQLEYFLLGATLTIGISTTTNLLLPLVGIYQYSKLGPIGTVFLIFFTTLAITRYHLFEIRVILTELLVGLMGIILVLLPFVMPMSSLKILTGAVFILFCIFGYYLIKATHEESKRREEAEKITVQERALRQRAEKLAKEFERLDRAKSQFILATQHHLRTPLSIIKGYASMLLEGSYGRVEEKAKKALSGIQESIERLIKLVNEFLDISQLQVGREILKKEETQIEKIIEEIIEELNPSAKEKGIYLKLEVEEGLPKIKLDRTKIKTAIFNVIDNGIKYTRKGGVTIRLKIKDLRLKIIVKDTGIGLAKEEIKTLFTEFFERGKEAEKIYTTGRGIGLYVAKNIIEAHRGKIWGESEGKGKGSTFYIELPLE